VPTFSLTNKNHNFQLSYKIQNLNNKQDIVILHGWGSNKEIMQNAFAGLLPNFKLVFIDMPGFGKSTNTAVLDTQEYADILEQFLREQKIHKNIIIGHSFGGKVATLLQPKHLILLSSAGIVPTKRRSVRIKIALFKILKSLGLGMAYKYFASSDANRMNQNMYETFKQVVNEDFTAIFTNFPNNALIFWGESDDQTPLSSGQQISSLLPKNQFFPLAGDHFFFANKKNAQIIAQEIQKLND